MQATYCDLQSTGLIAVSGEDAIAFLQAQLTSDVAALATGRTQFSGYCSPKGRLLATFLLWRRESDVILALPTSLRPQIQSRLGRYVLRARVFLADAGSILSLFGVAGTDAASAIASAGLPVPHAVHEIAAYGGAWTARLPTQRYAVLVQRERAQAVAAALEQHARKQDENLWNRSEIEAGVPVITSETQERYVPQMVNLDLNGGISYTKGCYPGQEIVARTHYLGRLKQRMYRVRITTEDIVKPGDSLYSADFGADQASGSIVAAARVDATQHEALAVVQKSSAHAGTLHFKTLDGPLVELLDLPYALPD